MKNWGIVYENHPKMPCSVPCTFYGTLIKNGLLADPYYRDNEKQTKALYYKDCRFETEFTADAETLAKKEKVLVFEGLDTICDIYLNGMLLGQTDNMHRTWRYSVNDLLTEGTNTLAVDIHSAVAYFQEENRKHNLIGNGDSMKGHMHIRKAGYMMGWDWGPTLPDMGIWRPVYLLAYDTRIAEAELRQKHLPDGSVIVTCKTEIENNSPELRAELVLTDEDGNSVSAETVLGKAQVTVTEPKLWWPNGYGGQCLYTAQINLYRGEELIDQVTKTIGLRTLTISQDKDEWGNEFCFQINGLKIFSMGANFIPEDTLLNRLDPKKTEYLIQKCAEANFNTLRVWGGGYYPDDSFFDLCDRYGIIVWQDFMFACGNVWLTEKFEETIKAEFVDNLKRIRHHASLGVLCGNNEVDEMMRNEVWNTPLARYDYLRLYCHIIPDMCAKYAPDTFYWSSSPSSGTPLVDTMSNDKGDLHSWGVWGNNLKTIESYKKTYPRFLSEFGFQSYPDMETMETCTLPEDRNMFSEIMDCHQKNKNGNGKLMFYAAQYYCCPDTFAKQIYTSQLLQEMAIRTAVEHLRRHRGRCMGALYWQLNDCWPVASWASIDYEGRLKALHYGAKQFFAPVLLSADVQDKKIILNLSNEKKETISGIAVWRLKDTSFRTVWEDRESGTLNGLSAKDIAVLDMKDIPESRRRETFLEYEFYSDSGERLSYGTVLFVRPKQFRYPTPNINVQVQEKGEGRFILSVTADSFARKVKLGFENLSVKEVDLQYFDIVSAEPITVEVVTKDAKVTAEQLKKSITWMTERDIAIV